MKVGLIQALDSSSISDYQVKYFWQPCIDSVKEWAQRCGYGYHFYKSSILTNVQQRLGIKWQHPKTKEIQWNKFAWLRQQAENYDLLMWVDADTLVWGQPNLFLRKSDLTKFNFLNGSLVFSRYETSWTNVVTPIFWCPSSLLIEIDDWINLMLDSSESRSDLFKTIMICSERFKIDFSIEMALSALYYEKKEKFNLIDRDEELGNEWYTTYKSTDRLLKKDSLIHFDGDNKFRYKQRVDAYRAYLAYEEGRHIWIK